MVLADDPSMQLDTLPPTLKAKLAQSDVSSHSTEHSSAVATVAPSPNCTFVKMVNPATGPLYLSLKHASSVVVSVVVVDGVVVVSVLCCPQVPHIAGHRSETRKSG